jgi:hypothetical protein
MTGPISTAGYPTTPGLATDLLNSIDQRCQDAVTRFVSGVRPNGPMGRIPPRARARVTLPSTTQWAYGQRWFACEVVPNTDSLPIEWIGSAHLAGLKVPPVPFATCALGVGGNRVDCRLPHNAEQLTLTDDPTGGPQGCYELAAAIMKTTDPTYGGAVVVAARRVETTTECWVATQGSATLSGTVIGHGSGPLPPG